MKTLKTMPLLLLLASGSAGTTAIASPPSEPRDFVQHQIHVVKTLYRDALEGSQALSRSFDREPPNRAVFCSKYRSLLGKISDMECEWNKALVALRTDEIANTGIPKDALEYPGSVFAETKTRVWARTAGVREICDQSAERELSADEAQAVQWQFLAGSGDVAGAAPALTGMLRILAHWDLATLKREYVELPEIPVQDL